MDTSINKTFGAINGGVWPVATTGTTLGLAIVSIAVNFFLIYMLHVDTSKSSAKNSVYFVIAQISYFLIILLTVDIGFIVVSYVNINKTFLILYDTHNHLLLALYSLVIMFSFNNFVAVESYCRHCVKILWIITTSMILYSMSLIMCNDKLIYSFVYLRIIAFLILIVMLACRITLFLYRSCIRVETEMLQSVLILSFLCCWFPDFLFNFLHVSKFDLLVICCIDIVACASNVIFNIILMVIVDEYFRTRFLAIMKPAQHGDHSEHDKIKVHIIV